MSRTATTDARNSATVAKNKAEQRIRTRSGGIQWNSSIELPQPGHTRHTLGEDLGECSRLRRTYS